MPKYVSIAAHLSVEELALRSRKATHAVERSHYQLIWLLARGKRVREVAEITGYPCQLDQNSRAALQSGGASSPC